MNLKSIWSNFALSSYTYKNTVLLNLLNLLFLLNFFLNKFLEFIIELIRTINTAFKPFLFTLYSEKISAIIVGRSNCTKWIWNQYDRILHLAHIHIKTLNFQYDVFISAKSFHYLVKSQRFLHGSVLHFFMNLHVLFESISLSSASQLSWKNWLLLNIS